jgi:hypothetical protein
MNSLGSIVRFGSARAQKPGCGVGFVEADPHVRSKLEGRTIAGSEHGGLLHLDRARFRTPAEASTLHSTA